MINLHELTIKKFHDGLLKKDFSALEIVQEFLRHIRENDKKIGSYLNLMEESAVKQAEEVDLAVAKEEEIGLLAGAPLAVKDNILIEGFRTTAASKILENYAAAYDAFVIQKLRDEKGIFLGKTNMDEFAMGSSTENSAFQLTRNPNDLSRVPGGSSGGSAAAVAGHLALAALGSDTGGSIRQPAAFCGVVGLKPTYGAVSRSGLIAMASSLDQIGPITKTVEDAAILFKAVAGRDIRDATSANIDYGEEILNPDFQKIKSLTIGLPKEYFTEGLDEQIKKEVETAIKAIESLGLKFKKISLPHTKYALSCYYIIMPAEVSANLARFDGIRYGRMTDNKGREAGLNEIYFKTRGLGFGTEVKRRIILGTFVLSSGYYDAYYQKAQQARSLIKNDFERTFKEVDAILTPVTPTPAFRIGEKTDDPLSMYLSDILTIPVNLAGLPAVSIPARANTGNQRESALPVGFQLIGRPYREADILGIGRYYEQIVSSEAA